MTTLGELCNRTVTIARRDEPVLEIARVMRDHHVGCVVVVEDTARGRVPIGVLTDRDLVVRAMAGHPSELGRLRVGDVLAGRLVVGRERESIGEGLGRMRAFGVRRLPIVDADDVLQGIVTLDDTLEHLADHLGELAHLLGRERARERAREPEPEVARPRLRERERARGR